MRSPFMLNSGWYEKGVPEYLVANVVAEAAKDLGVTDDRAVSVPKVELAGRRGGEAGDDHSGECCTRVS